MPKNKFIYILIPLVAITIFGLWPLKSIDNTTINESLIAGKAKYLSEISSLYNSEDTLPNIVLIVADDLGISDVDYNIESTNITTPIIASLAKEGVQYENAYTASPICATSRAALLTGRYQNRYGFEYQIQNRYGRNRLTLWAMQYLVNSNPWVLKWIINPPSKEQMNNHGLPNSEISIAEMLKHGAGYKTGIFGKWHLGKQKGKLPSNFGFDIHYGFYNSHSLFIPESTEGYVDIKNPKDWTDQYIWTDQRNGLSAIVQNDSIIEEDRYLTDGIAQEAIAFIDKNKDKRFFAYVPFSAPHTPFQAPQSLYEEFSHISDPIKRVYATMIKSMDLNIREIYNALSKNDLLNNTIIIITSDNGGARYTHATDNAPYKGGKINSFEGGLRVPFIIHHTGRYTINDTPHRVSTMDIFSTIAHLTKIPMPYDRQMDGLRLPVDIKSSNNNPRINQYTLIDSAQQILDNRSLHWGVGNNNTLITGDYKIIYRNEKNSSIRLYNIAEDPYEKNNLATEQPQIVKQLISQQKTWRDEMPSPLWPGVIDYMVEDDGETLLFSS